MQIFFIAFFALLFIMAIMAVGVLLGRKPISGSCGGVGAALGQKDYVCELCGNDETKCEEIKANNAPSNNDLKDHSSGSFYNADKKRLF